MSATEEMANLMTAKELAERLHMTPPTLYRQLKEGPPKIRNGGKGFDVRQLPDRWYGGKRFWLRSAVEELLAESQ